MALDGKIDPRKTRQAEIDPILDEGEIAPQSTEFSAIAAGRHMLRAGKTNGQHSHPRPALLGTKNAKPGENAVPDAGSECRRDSHEWRRSPELCRQEKQKHESHSEEKEATCAAAF